MEFTQEELQNVRHLIGASTNMCAKLNYYCNSSTDENVKNLLEQVCTLCTNVKSYLTEKL